MTQLFLKIVAPMDHEEFIIPIGTEGYNVKQMKGHWANSCELAQAIRNYFQLFGSAEAPTEVEVSGHTRTIYQYLESMHTPMLTYKYIQEAEKSHPEYIKNSIKQLGGECPESLFDPSHIGIYALLFSEGLEIPLITQFTYYVVNESGRTFAKL